MVKLTKDNIIHILYEYSGFLLGGTAIAMVWANLNYVSYKHFTHSVHFWVNDVAMAFFFAIAAKEIFESFLPGGTLSSPKEAALPLLATIGGMLGPAGLFATGCVYFGAMELMNGWAVPCATDIAFSYLFARIIFGAKHPAIPFLLLLAIADDALGLIILAVFYPSGDMNLLLFAILVGIALFMAWRLKKAKVQNFWYYLIPGAISWFGFFYGGIHPALSLVPIIFFMPHAHTDLGILHDDEAKRSNTLDKFAAWWEKPVEIILGVFGLVNAGIVWGTVGTGTWLVFGSLLIGKTFGVLIFVLVGMLFGLKLSGGMNIKDVFVVGNLAGIGFTVALFVATVAFEPGFILETTKMGAVFSFAAILLAIISAKILRIQKQV